MNDEIKMFLSQMFGFSYFSLHSSLNKTIQYGPYFQRMWILSQFYLASHSHIRGHSQSG